MGGKEGSSKWASRASCDPFRGLAVDGVASARNSSETAAVSTKEDDDGKENRMPSSGRNWDQWHVTMRHSTQESWTTKETRVSTRDGVTAVPISLLGKRSERTEASSVRIDPFDVLEEDQEAKFGGKRSRKDPEIGAKSVECLEARGVALDESLWDSNLGEKDERTGAGDVTMLVNELSHVGQLNFGCVALGERKSRQLTLENAQEAGNARVKYEGYTMVASGRGKAIGGTMKKRFKCDLHVCVIDALKSVTLRVTFEPLPADVGHQVTAMLRFRVNDRLKLECRARGTVAPRAVQVSRIGRMRQFEQMSASSSVKLKRPVRAGTRQVSDKTSSEPSDTTLLKSGALSHFEPELEPGAKTRIGDKRRSSVVLEVSPPRNGAKRRKSGAYMKTHKLLSPGKDAGACQNSLSMKNFYTGSWWKQRQETYDDNWMAKQTEGFTKWMNYVLLDGTAFRLSGCGQQDGTEEPIANTRRRFDYSSLRVLAQKRMESSWVQAAAELYHCPSMDDVLFNLQDEIGNQRLRFRADRPVYADVGLQEDLIRLLNNYHPVWLCLGLYAVLGNQVMIEEKCSLRTIFSTSCAKTRTLESKDTPSDGKMPRVLRRIILKHLVKDSHVAQSYRLVKNLMTPLDGSIADRYDGGNAFTNTKKNINGREYFDSLTQSFMLKFFMLVLFLDRAINHKSDRFTHFPCLFRIARSTKSAGGAKTHTTTQRDHDDDLRVKHSKVFVTEFCRLFLASEGRIDKHLEQLGYTLKHEQTALDEIDVEITNLETDLRDGIRLAKLMEALTAPVSSMAKQVQDGTLKPKGLSTFLRVPALSRLQKVHNVEICLYFLQDKCGASVLDSLKSSSSHERKLQRLSGRARVSSSGFAGLQTRVDAKVVENLAKDIVDGHREKTLALLWQLISSFQLQSLVDPLSMKRETLNVIKRMSFRAKDFFDCQQENAPLELTKEHECYGLLLEWCRAVCANYNVSVKDFSSSFADGKALCYLLHYYHPMLLPKVDILPTTSDRRDDEMSEKTLLRNEQRHFGLMNDRIKQLGEIPVLIPQEYNTKNPPEEKMVVTFVCYLQSRLMDSSSEIHAASRLKRWWKSPLIRLQLHRKKNLGARIIQRFWYTSSQARLAVRQCRKLLRAAHLVKSTVLSYAARRRFLRRRQAVVTLQTMFRTRRQVRLLGTLLGAVLVIQYHWRKQCKRRQETNLQAQVAVQRKATQRVLVKASAAIIERKWLEYLSREGARLVRQQMIADRHVAVMRIQGAWRQGRVRVAARTHRMQLWRQEHLAARSIQTTWRGFQCRQRETQRILALHRVEQLMKEKEREKRRRRLKGRVETRAATCIQKGFRKFGNWKRERAATKLASAFRGAKQKLQFQLMKGAAGVLQCNVRVWRRRRQLRALTHFYSMLQVYQRRKASEAQRHDMQLQQLKLKVKTRATRRIQDLYQRYRFQKQTLAATRIQSVALAWLARKRYANLRLSACLLQKNVRRWRRHKQIRALLAFHGLLVRYQRMQQEEDERQERVRQDRLRCLQEHVANRAASRIQSIYRSYTYHRRTAAATLIQAVCRGLIAQQRYVKARTSVLIMQRFMCSWMAGRNFRRALYRHRASVSIQKRARGWIARRRFSFYALQAQLMRMRALMSCWQIEHWYTKCMAKYREKRTLVVRCHWTRFCAAIVHKRRRDATKIVRCWRSFHFRKLLNARLEQRRQTDAAARWMQMWWLGLRCKWVERQRREELRRQREMEAKALTMAKMRAKRIVASWLFEKVVVPTRERNFYLILVRKVQAWWRGTLVRLHESSPEIIQQRKKFSSMKLVGQEQRLDLDTSSTGLKQFRVKSSDEKTIQSEQPQTLGARLDMALHMLLHGKRLQDMLFASHTIEVCTRYSRECCHKCVQLQISSTIFAAIRGLNRSRPHVELLHQLLLVLKNLTTYRRSTDVNKLPRAFDSDETKGRLDVDLRALDTLVDLLHIHRDMHHIFMLSADVIAYYLKLLKPLLNRNVNVQESWKEAEKRLSGLQELLSRKLALHNATASFRRGTQSSEKEKTNNLMRKMNPKTAVAIMEQLVVLLKVEKRKGVHT